MAQGRPFLTVLVLAVAGLALAPVLMAATLVDLGSIQGWRVYGFAWGVVVLSLANYPYVFLLTTDSFSRLGQRQLEACRTLGLGPWGSFLRVALPLTLPAVGAGIALSGGVARRRRPVGLRPAPCAEPGGAPAMDESALAGNR